MNMKFLVPVVIAHVLQCVASKSWNSDSYQEETFSVFGWIGYLKRLLLITLMLSGVVLYYVPESRPHARRICYALIDFTANGLKSVLNAHEDEQVYEKIKSNFHRARYVQSMASQKRIPRVLQEDDEDFGYHYKSQGKKAKMFMDSDGLSIGYDRVKEKKKTNLKQKDHRQLRHRVRSSIGKDISEGDPPTETEKPLFLYPDKLDDLQKYLRTTMYSVKRPSNASVENYALLISGNPQEMAMLDEKYTKDDIVIVQDPYVTMEFKECGTSTDKLSSIAEVSGSEQEGPTRDYTNHPIEQGMETYVKEVELNSIPEGGSRYSVNKSLYQTSQYQCGGECCGNGCSISSSELNNNREVFVSSSDLKNVLKTSRSMVTPKLHKKVEEGGENVHQASYTKYNHEGARFSKSSSVNSRKVDFEKQTKMDHPHQKGEDKGLQCKSVRKRKSRADGLSKGFCCTDVSYLTDRSGEADDEVSHRGEREKTEHDLDVKPQRENYFYEKQSDDSIFDHVCDDFEAEPILKNRMKPALLRAVNWIFGGCPEASKRGKIRKEENQEIADEWLF